MSIVDRANRPKVDPKLIEELLEAVADEPDKRDFEGTTIEIVKRVSQLGLPERQRMDLGLAISFRLQALAALMQEGGGRGWTLPAEPGCTLLHAEMIRCAAEEPMIEVDGQVAFDRESFHRRLLSTAEMHGQA